MSKENSTNRAILDDVIQADTENRSQTPSSWQEQRRHRRVQLDISVRFMLSDQTEYIGTILDISAGGLALLSDAKPALGTAVVFYIDDLGRYEGQVRRILDHGFAVEFSLSDNKKDKTADNLTWLINRQLVADQNDRQHQRSVLMKEATLKRADGSQLACEIIDMSLGGVLLSVTDRPPIGEIIEIGQMEGRVVRHTETGVGIEFLNVNIPRRKLSGGLFKS